MASQLTRSGIEAGGGRMLILSLVLLFNFPHSLAEETTTAATTATAAETTTAAAPTPAPTPPPTDPPTTTDDGMIECYYCGLDSPCDNPFALDDVGKVNKTGNNNSKVFPHLP